MMRSGIYKAVFFLLCMQYPVFSSTWSDSLIAALSANEPAAVFRLSKKVESGCDFASQYRVLVKKKKGSPSALKSMSKFDRDVFSVLRRQVSNSCFSAFEQALEDTALGESIRIEYLHAVMFGGHKLSIQKKAAFSAVLEKILAQASQSPRLKIEMLMNMGRYPGTADEKVFFKYIASSDSQIKSAAFQGLSKKIKVNRDSKKGAENSKILQALIALDTSSQHLERIRVIAAIGDGNSRDYLLSHCAGNPEKIAAIFHQDETLDHPGIIREALSLSKSYPENQTLEKAIRSGLRNPEKIIVKLVQGPSPDTGKGLDLLRRFPEYAPRFTELLQKAGASNTPAVKTAYSDLLPSLPTSKADHD